MDGQTLAKICDEECLKRGISKAQFYKDIGVSAPSFHGWKNGARPSQKYIDAIEKYFGINLNDVEKSDPREELREDHKMLLKSVDGLPQSSVYEIIAEIHKRREAGWGDPTY